MSIPASAAYFESASLGPTGVTFPGPVIFNNFFGSQFYGVRFEVTGSIQVTAVGAHIAGNPNAVSLLFAAIAGNTRQAPAWYARSRKTPPRPASCGVWWRWSQHGWQHCRRRNYQHSCLQHRSRTPTYSAVVVVAADSAPPAVAQAVRLTSQARFGHQCIVGGHAVRWRNQQLESAFGNYRALLRQAAPELDIRKSRWLPMTSSILYATAWLQWFV